MATTLHYISILEGIVSGLPATTPSRWNRKKLTEILNEGRAIGLSKTIQNGSRLNPIWQQKITIPFSALNQEDECFSTFPFPYSVIKATKAIDGCIFVGNEDFTVAYNRINTRGQLLNYSKHPILGRAFTQGTAALLEDGQWFVYSNKAIRTLGVIAIFNDPVSLPYFNIEKDDYPLDETTFDFVRGYLKEQVLNQIESTPIATESTNRDISQYQVSSKRR